MRRYHFDLVEADTVTEASGAILDNDDQAGKVARELAQEVRQQRPELVGHGYAVLVRSESGEEIWRAAIDHPGWRTGAPHNVDSTKVSLAGAPQSKIT